MSETLEVRLARADELSAVGEITVQGYVHDGFLQADDGYVAHLRGAAQRAQDAELWVALLDGVVVGTVTFCPPGSPLRELSRDGEGEFRMLAVAPEARRQGVARALVAASFDRCRDLGLDAMVLCSMPVMTKAHALYESFGFVRDESLDWEPEPGLPLLGFRCPV